MQISDVKAYPVTVDQPVAQHTAQGAYKRISILVVRLETDDGIVGWGEGLARYAPRAHAALVDELLAPIVRGADPFAVEALWQRMFRVLSGRSGGVLIEAIAAVDMALWDIMGKALGAPVHRLLGHSGRTRLRAYASSIGWEDDEAAVAQTQAALALGFREIKVKLAGPVEAACRRARLVRDTAGPAVCLAADANWAFDVDDALRVGRVLADLDYSWFEEPIAPEDHDGYRLLRDKSAIRLAAGESEYTAAGAAELIASRSIGVVQPDVARAGGITETRRIAGLAHAFHVHYTPHIGFSGALCVAASLQLAAAAPNFLTFECMVFENPLRDALVADPPGDRRNLVDGCVAVPEGPGLGVTVDEDALGAFAAR